MRSLAIDLGAKRTGLAVGDDETKIATPAGIIETASAEQRLDMIHRAIREHQPGALVVGLPLNMDGSEGPAGRRARQFARQLEARSALSVHLADERLSSDAADDHMTRSGLTHKAKKARRDALAAAEILRRFLERR